MSPDELVVLAGGVLVAVLCLFMGSALAAEPSRSSRSRVAHRAVTLAMWIGLPLLIALLLLRIATDR
jgi:hypothetical protein